MLKKLNDKHLKLAENLCDGLMLQEQAYIQAGFKDTPSAGHNISRILRDPLFKEHLKRLRVESIGGAILTLSEAKEILSGLAVVKWGERATRIQAIKQLAVMSAWNETTVNVKVTSADEMSDEELAKLIK